MSPQLAEWTPRLLTVGAFHSPISTVRACSMASSGWSSSDTLITGANRSTDFGISAGAH